MKNMKKEKSSKNVSTSKKELWKIIDSRIATLASIVTIVLVFIDESKIFKYILCGIILLYLGSLGVYVVRSIFNTSYAKMQLEREYSRKNKNIAVRLHKYYHNLIKITTSVSTLNILKYEDVVDKYQNLCDYLAEFYKTLFSEYLGDNTVSVCIKLVQTEMIFDEAYMNWAMETIARSASTIQKRSNIDDKPVKISENTDFQVILSDAYKDELFAICDMRNIKEDFLHTYGIKYENSRGEDFLDYYQSTIVLPIKTDGKYIAKELMSGEVQGKRSFVLGFLCIDSMKAFETEEEKNIFSVGIEYTKSFADTLYPLFEKILISCRNNAKINKAVQDVVENENPGQNKGIFAYNSRNKKNKRNRK